MVGAFLAAAGVLIDTAVLRTLPEREYRAGLAEVVKYGIILDAEFFTYLEAHVADLRARQDDVLREVVAQCCRLKARSSPPTNAKRLACARCSTMATHFVTPSRR